MPTNACAYCVDKAADAVKHPTMDRKTPAAQYSAQRVTSTNLGKTAWIASAPWSGEKEASMSILMASYWEVIRLLPGQEYIVSSSTCWYSCVINTNPLVCFCFWNKILTCSPGLTQTSSLPASASHVLRIIGIYNHAMYFGFFLFFLFFWRQGLIKPLLD